MSSISSGTTSTTTLVHSGDTTGSLVFKTNDTGSGGTTAMTIDTSQNVGIGTTSPNSKVSVAHSSTNTSVLGAYANIPLLLQNTSNTDNNWSVIAVQDASGDFSSYIGTQNTSQSSNTSIMAFATNSGSGATERMRINSGGSALFSCGNFSTGVTSSSAGFAIENNGNSPFINHSQTATSLQTYYAFINGNGTVGTIKCTGSTTQFNTSSDVRLKKNIGNSPSAIASIEQIGIKSFDWKADDLHQEYGVIAQELDLIAPEAVSHGATEDEMWGVDYSKLVPRMIKAMQEQQATITALTARIEALEGK